MNRNFRYISARLPSGRIGIYDLDERKYLPEKQIGAKAVAEHVDKLNAEWALMKAIEEDGTEQEAKIHES